VRVWDAQTGRELLKFQGGHTYVLALTFSPDSKRLVSASGDRTVKLWDAQTGQETLAFKGHASVGGSATPVFDSPSVAFSPDGHRLGGTFWAGAVTIWDATPLPEKP
jgi:WD40 repeat protein